MHTQHLALAREHLALVQGGKTREDALTSLRMDHRFVDFFSQHSSSSNEEILVLFVQILAEPLEREIPFMRKR